MTPKRNFVIFWPHIFRKPAQKRCPKFCIRIFGHFWSFFEKCVGKNIKIPFSGHFLYLKTREENFSKIQNFRIFSGIKSEINHLDLFISDLIRIFPNVPEYSRIKPNYTEFNRKNYKIKNITKFQKKSKIRIKTTKMFFRTPFLIHF